MNDHAYEMSMNVINVTTQLSALAPYNYKWITLAIARCNVVFYSSIILLIISAVQNLQNSIGKAYLRTRLSVKCLQINLKQFHLHRN